MSAAVAPDGAIFVRGWFRRGTYQLPGLRAWRGRRWGNSFVARLDPSDGRVLWAKQLVSGTEETHLAAVSARECLFATHRGPRGGDQDVVVYRLVDGRVRSRITFATNEKDYPEGLHAFADGSFALLSYSWSGQGGEHTPRLTVYDRRGRRVSQRELSPHSTMLSGTGGPAHVLMPGALDQLPRSHYVVRVTDRLAIVSVDGKGHTQERWVRPPNGGQWLWSAVGGGVSRDATWLAAVSRHDSGYELVVSDVRSLPAAPAARAGTAVAMRPALPAERRPSPASRPRLTF